MLGPLSRIRSIARVTRRDPHLVSVVVSAYLLLVASRAAIMVLPLRSITRRLGEAAQETEPHTTVTAEQLSYARRVAWSIRKAAPYTPTDSNCYPQALAAHVLLHRKGIPSTVYYGAAFDSEGTDLETHVWVRCGAFVVTGAPVHEKFAVVAAHADVPSGRT